MRTIFGQVGKANDRGDAAGAAAAGCRMAGLLNAAPGLKDRNRRKRLLFADSGEGGQAFHLKADSESGRWRTAFR
jgi:hypothetical protein